MTNPGDPSFAVDHECAGDAVSLGSLHVRVVGRTVLIDCDGVIGLLVPLGLRDEGFDEGELFVAHADDVDALILVFLLKFGEVGHARFAGTAPGCPEFHDRDLAGGEAVEVGIAFENLLHARLGGFVADGERLSLFGILKLWNRLRHGRDLLTLDDPARLVLADDGGRMLSDGSGGESETGGGNDAHGDLHDSSVLN